MASVKRLKSKIHFKLGRRHLAITFPQIQLPLLAQFQSLIARFPVAIFFDLGNLQVARLPTSNATQINQSMAPSVFLTKDKVILPPPEINDWLVTS